MIPADGARTVHGMEGISLSAETTALVVVDIQDRLAAAMPPETLERTLKNVTTLIECARLLDMPVIVTEQYPKGLGPTHERVKQALATLPRPARVVEKVVFDATLCRDFAAALDDVLRVDSTRLRTVVLTGMEAHICVYQTARGLCEQRVAVHVPVDAACSRSPENARIAESLWNRVGAVVTTTESVAFDLLGQAGTEPFKAISKLVR